MSEDIIMLEYLIIFYLLFFNQLIMVHNNTIKNHDTQIASDKNQSLKVALVSYDIKQ